MKPIIVALALVVVVALAWPRAGKPPRELALPSAPPPASSGVARPGGVVLQFVDEELHQR